MVGNMDDAGVLALVVSAEEIEFRRRGEIRGRVRSVVYQADIGAVAEVAASVVAFAMGQEVETVR